MRFSKLSGIATGLVLTFACQTFGHDIDLAGSCRGYDCYTAGQLCKDVPGASSNAYVCVDKGDGKNMKWTKVPASWPGESHEFALLFHDHDDAHDEIATMFGSEASSTEAVQPEDGDTFSEEQVEEKLRSQQAEQEAEIEQLKSEHKVEMERLTSDLEDEIAKLNKQLESKEYYRAMFKDEADENYQMFLDEKNKRQSCCAKACGRSDC